MTSHAQKEGGKRVPLLSRTSTESFVFSDEPLVSCVQHALLVLLLLPTTRSLGGTDTRVDCGTRNGGKLLGTTRKRCARNSCTSSSHTVLPLWLSTCANTDTQTHADHHSDNSWRQQTCLSLVLLVVERVVEVVVIVVVPMVVVEVD